MDRPQAYERGFVKAIADFILIAFFNKDTTPKASISILAFRPISFHANAQIQCQLAGVHSTV